MIRIQPEARVEIMHVDGADPAVPLPSYETAQAAGMDVRANFDAPRRGHGITLQPGARALIPTGFAIALPRGYEMQVRPRSGLALKHGIMLVNSPGTIDADYRGPVGVIMLNAGQDPFTVAHGDRIAQLVLAPVFRTVWRKVDTLDTTKRGAGGFGSTGV